MYNIEADTYTCDFCGFEMEWDATAEKHGELWGCEKWGRQEKKNLQEPRKWLCVEIVASSEKK